MTSPWPYAGDGTTFQPEVDAARAVPHTVRLDGVEYAVELKDYQHRAEPSLRDTIVSSAQPDDSLYTSDGAWSRYAYSWHHGAGAVAHDFGEDPDPFQFLTSAGVDCWTPGQLTLLRKPIVFGGTYDLKTYIDSGGVTTTHYPALISLVGTCAAVGAAGNGLRSALGLTSNKVMRLGAGATTVEYFTAANNLDGTPQCLLANPVGTRNYIGTSTGIQYYDEAEYASNIYDGTLQLHDFAMSPSYSWDHLYLAGDRLIGMVNQAIYEIGSGGTITLVYDHPDPAVEWRGCFALGSRVYIVGMSGQTSFVWSLTVDSSGNLVWGADAMDMPSGEEIFSAIGTLGFAVLGTSEGARLARPSGDGTLEYGPAICRNVDNVTARYPYRRGVWGLAAYGGYVYGVVAEHPGGGYGLVRISLATFTGPLRPAWNWDVFLNASGAIEAARDSNAIIHPTTFFRNTGDPVWTQSGIPYCVPLPAIDQAGEAAFDQEGWVEAGYVSFGTVEPKRLESVQVVGDAFGISTEFEVLVDDDDYGLLTNETQRYSAIDDPVRGMTVDLHDQFSERTRVRVTMRDGGSRTPLLSRWRLRGMPIVPPMEEWIVPLRLSNVVIVNGGAGQGRSLDVEGQISRLRNRWRSKEPIEFREGSTTYRVRIDNFEIHPIQWQDTGKGYEARVLVKLISV